jgi:hypothetical protein
MHTDGLSQVGSFTADLARSNLASRAGTAIPVPSVCIYVHLWQNCLACFAACHILSQGPRSRRASQDPVHQFAHRSPPPLPASPQQQQAVMRALAQTPCTRTPYRRSSSGAHAAPVEARPPCNVRPPSTTAHLTRTAHHAEAGRPATRHQPRLIQIKARHQATCDAAPTPEPAMHACNMPRFAAPDRRRSPTTRRAIGHVRRRSRRNPGGAP